jgi:hypothetical protein
VPHAYTPSEANRLYLKKAVGTCPDCGVTFHRLRTGRDIPAHVAGETTHQWAKKVWSNGVTTIIPASRRSYRLDHNGASLCMGSGARVIGPEPTTVAPRPKGEPGPAALAELFRI